MTTNRPFHRAVCVLAVVVLASGLKPATAQTVVVGTGNPDVDVPAVQAAVNQGVDVILKGHFSFNRPPTIQTPPATVLVSKAVTISGAQNEDDERASIEGGSIPFYVEAPGASVTIQGLRFIRPVERAILVAAANGLTIANCKIEGIVTVPSLRSTGIDIDTADDPPTVANPGHPEKIFGTVLVTHNEIDVAGGTSADDTLGIVVFSVGQSPGNEAHIYIVGNKIRNTTQPAINIRHIGGQAFVEGNEIDTGSVSGQAATPEVIRAVNTGLYVIAHNTIQCEWPDAIGIGVFSQIPNNPSWNMKNAVVMDNSVTLSPPPGATFGNLSAGIDIRGFANDNVVTHNRIRGRARAALAVDLFKGGIPANNAFLHNDLTGFAASSADIFIGEGVTDTLLIGRKGTIEDQGVGTQVVR